MPYAGQFPGMIPARIETATDREEGRCTRMTVSVTVTGPETLPRRTVGEWTLTTDTCSTPNRSWT